MEQPISNTAPQEDAVAMAMARRGMGAGQQAPNMGSQMSPDMSGGQSMPPMDMGGMPMGASKGKQEFQPKDGHEFLLTTLAETLKNDYKLESERLKYGQSAPML